MELSKRKSAGFTLIELLVVIAIVGAVAAAVLVSVAGPRRKARDTTRLQNIKQVQTALELYFNNSLRYPASLDQLAPEYIPVVPKDPFGTAYFYSARGTDSTCGSYHLGANFEESSNPALQQDSDQPSAAVCSGSGPDFNGKDAVACGGSSGDDGCYDIVPEISALQEQGIEPPPEGGGGAPEEGPPPPPAGPVETYRFSGGSGRPQFVEATIQPRVIKVGDSQALSVRVSDTAGVLSVTAVTELDHSSKSITFQPADGAQSGCTDCTWSATWVVNDTSDTTYHTIFTAENMAHQKNSVTLGWSNTLHSPPLSGDWTLDCNCSVSTVDGVDNGDFTAASPYTLTLLPSSAWVINKGRRINLSGGTIALSSLSSIQFTNIWIKDADADSYADSLTDQVAQDSQPVNYARRKDELNEPGLADCDATSASVYQNVGTLVSDNDQDGYSDTSSATQCVGGTTTANARTYYKDSSGNYTWESSSASLGTDCGDSSSLVWRNRYRDADGDTYGVSSATCVGNDAGYVDNNTDCYDSGANAANAYPGQTTYYSTARGDGSYDYNCDSSASKQYTGAGGTCSSTCCTTDSLTNCTSHSYTGNADNGASVACGSTITSTANAACGSAGCVTTSPTQACR